MPFSEFRIIPYILGIDQYAFRHVGKHLCKTGALGDKLFMDAFSELVPQWRRYAHSILCQIETAHVPAGSKTLYTRDLITALDSFSTTLEVVESLHHSHSINIFRAFWLVLISHSALASDSPSSLVWNAEITKSLEASQASFHLQLMFSIVTNLIISLNNIELAVFNYDTGVKPLVGTGILLHSVWYCKQTLAQWMISQNFRHLDPQCELLQSDNYFFPKLLLALPAVGHSLIHFPDQPVFNHMVLVPILVTFSVIGHSIIWCFYVALLCIHLALSQIRRYSFLPPRQLPVSLPVVKCCLLFLFAVQTLLLSYTETLIIMITLLSVVNNVVLEKRFPLTMPFSSQLQFIVYWLGRNPNIILSLFSALAACSLVIQLNAIIIYLLFEHAIHTIIDPYRFYYVLGCYAGLEGSSSGVVSVKM